MSYPILFDRYENDFNHNGVGVLNDAISCEIHEVLNGQFELLMEYPANARYAKEFKDYMIIKAKPNDTDEMHEFRIYDIAISVSEKRVTIKAMTKTNDIGNNLVMEYDSVIEVTPQTALNSILTNSVDPYTYSFYSDISSTSRITWVRRNPLNCLMGERGSLLDIFGGELKRGNNTIYWYKRRGNDNVATIRPRKNLKGMRMTSSTKGMVTKILPYIQIPDAEGGEPTTLVGTIVRSPLDDYYPIHPIVPVNFASIDDTITDISSLNTVASKYFTTLNPGCDRPKTNLVVDLLSLQDSSEYTSKFKNLEKIGLGDTVTVYHPDYDVDIELKVRELYYDAMRFRNVKMSIGDAPTSGNDAMLGSVSQQIQDTKNYMYNVLPGVVQSIVQKTADGQNDIYTGPDEPSINGKKIGDIWFKEKGSGVRDLYMFDGAYWQPVITEDILKEIEDIATNADIASQEALDLISGINDEILYINSEFTTMKNNVDSNISNLEQEVSATQDSLLATDSKAQQAIRDAGFVAQDLSTLESITEGVSQNALDALGRANLANQGLGGLQTKVDGIDVNVLNLGTELGSLNISVTNQGTTIGGLINNVSGLTGAVNNIGGTLGTSGLDMGWANGSISDEGLLVSSDTKIRTRAHYPLVTDPYIFQDKYGSILPVTAYEYASVIPSGGLLDYEIPSEKKSLWNVTILQLGVGTFGLNFPNSTSMSGVTDIDTLIASLGTFRTSQTNLRPPESSVTDMVGNNVSTHATVPYYVVGSIMPALEPRTDMITYTGINQTTGVVGAYGGRHSPPIDIGETVIIYAGRSWSNLVCIFYYDANDVYLGFEIIPSDRNTNRWVRSTPAKPNASYFRLGSSNSVTSNSDFSIYMVDTVKVYRISGLQIDAAASTNSSFLDSDYSLYLYDNIQHQWYEHGTFTQGANTIDIDVTNRNFTPTAFLGGFLGIPMLFVYNTTGTGTIFIKYKSEGFKRTVNPSDYDFSELKRKREITSQVYYKSEDVSSVRFVTNKNTGIMAFNDTVRRDYSNTIRTEIQAIADNLSITASEVEGQNVHITNLQMTSTGLGASVIDVNNRLDNIVTSIPGHVYKWTTGTLSTSTGAEAASTTVSRLDFVDVVEDTKLRLQSSSTTAVAVTIFRYTAAKVFISSSVVTVPIGDTYLYTVPTNGYIRATVASASASKIGISKYDDSLIAYELRINQLEAKSTSTTNTISQIQVDLTGKATVVAFNQVKSTVDAHAITISNIDGRLVSNETTINGIQTTVSDKADKTQVTQLASQWSTTTSLVNGHTSQISSLGTEINLAVSKGDVVGRINVQAGKTLIQQGTNVLMITETTTYISDATIKTAHIANAAITNAKIATLDAGKITTGILDASKITVTNLVITNTMIAVNSISGDKITTISGNKITTGTIDASIVTISKLNASNITTGTINGAVINVVNLNASSITSGTINGNLVNVTNLNASNITAGTLDVSRLTGNVGAFVGKGINGFSSTLTFNPDNIQIKNTMKGYTLYGSTVVSFTPNGTTNISQKHIFDFENGTYSHPFRFMSRLTAPNIHSSSFYGATAQDGWSNQFKFYYDTGDSYPFTITKNSGASVDLGFLNSTAKIRIENHQLQFYSTATGWKRLA